MKTSIIIILGLILGVDIFFTILHYRVPELINLGVRAPRDKRALLTWQNMGQSPLGDKKYTPQGMTWIDGYIVFANSWKNTKSRVYKINPTDMSIEGYFDMPPEAVHTSGLAWDGKQLYAVDYISNRLYCIDYQSSLNSNVAQLNYTMDTGLNGTSSCCIVPTDQDTLLAISDFRNTTRTYLIALDDALPGNILLDHVVFSYKSEGYSQGLEYVDGYLFESENKLGKNVINKLSLSKLRATGDIRASTVKQYSAPHWGVEDLAWDGEYLWTSDEVSYCIYKGKLTDE